MQTRFCIWIERGTHSTTAHTNISTQQIDEYEQLGSYALIGLPDQLYPTRYGTLWFACLCVYGFVVCHVVVVDPFTSWVKPRRALT